MDFLDDIVEIEFKKLHDLFEIVLMVDIHEGHEFAGGGMVGGTGVECLRHDGCLEKKECDFKCCWLGFMSRWDAIDDVGRGKKVEQAFLVGLRICMSASDLTRLKSAGLASPPRVAYQRYFLRRLD